MARNVKALRTVASALCIVIGAVLIATWAASMAALSAIEDDTVIEDAAAAAITSDLAQDELVDRGSELVLAALTDAGVNTDIVGIELVVRQLMERLASSDTFVTVVHAQAASVRQQVVLQLNAGGEGPITVALDFSDPVNAKLEEIPVVGPALPAITVPTVPVQVMDADTADKARTTWDWLHFSARWFGWLGLAFLALGMLVSYRKRWFLAKATLALGVVSGLIWFVATYVDPREIADRIPSGDVANAVILEIANKAAHSAANTAGYVALGAMMLSLVLFIVASRERKGVRP
jgi:hypothetical protein